MKPLELLGAIAASGPAMSALGDASCVVEAGDPEAGSAPRTLADLVREAVDRG